VRGRKGRGGDGYKLISISGSCKPVLSGIMDAPFSNSWIRHWFYFILFIWRNSKEHVKTTNMLYGKQYQGCSQ